MKSTKDEIAERFAVKIPDFDYVPNSRTVPPQMIPILFIENNELKIELMRIGLIPVEATNIESISKYINSWSNKMFSKPALRNSAKSRRCIIPVNGYYRPDRNEHGRFELLFTQKSSDIMCIAGLWGNWKSPQDEIVRSFTTLTTEPNDYIRTIHHRMPAILPLSSIDKWLTNGILWEEYESMLTPYPFEDMNCIVVDEQNFENPIKIL